MGLVRFILLTSLLVALALGAPSEEKAEKTAVETPSAEKKSSTEERGVVAVDQTWDAFFSGNTWNVVGSALGVVLLLGGLGLGVYYFYYLNYYAQDLHGSYGQQAYPYPNTVGTPNAYTQQYYSPIARSLETTGSWNWPQVLYMISLAQETYEKFDFQTIECQKKALCELSQKQNDFGETGRKVSSTFSFLDAVEGLPMPTIILTYLKEYREAINQGRNSSKDCGSVYPKCNFSLKEVFVKYQKRAAAEKF